MPLRPLNDTVVIIPDGELIPVDESQTVIDAVKSGLIVIPEKNSLMKLSEYGTVVSWGPKVKAPFKVGDRINYNQFAEKPVLHFEGDAKYRLILEHYIRAIIYD